MRRQELSGSVQRRARFVEDPVIGLAAALPPALLEGEDDAHNAANIPVAQATTAPGGGTPPVPGGGGGTTPAPGGGGTGTRGGTGTTGTAPATGDNTWLWIIGAIVIVAVVALAVVGSRRGSSASTSSTTVIDRQEPPPR